MELVNPKPSHEYLGTAYGTVLGDSSLVKPNPGNSRISGAQKHKEYAEYKANLLGAKVRERNDGYWEYKTGRLPMYSKMYDQMYYEGRKTVTPHVMSVLNDQGLALWYFDNGSYSKANMVVVLHTCAFNYAEQLVIQKSLHDRFGLRFSIIRQGKKHYRLRLRNGDRKHFFGIVSPYCPKVMDYKIPTAEEMEKIEVFLHKAKSSPSRYSLNSLVTVRPDGNDQAVQDALVTNLDAPTEIPAKRCAC